MEQGHERFSQQQLTRDDAQPRDRRHPKDRKYDDEPHRGSQRPGRRSYGGDNRYPDEDEPPPSSSRRRHDDYHRSTEGGGRFDRGRDRDDLRSSSRDDSRGRYRDDYRSGEGGGGGSQSRWRSDRPPRDYHHSRKEEEPSRVILLRNLNTSVTEDVIRKQLEAIRIYPVDIRLVVKVSEQKRFAFVEFTDEAGGVELMSVTGGLLKLGGDWCSLHYSIPRDGRKPHNEMYSDWQCPMCHYINFGRRKNCQKCDTSQDASRNLPTDVVLLRNLDIIVTEETVLSLLGQQTSLPIKTLKIPRDPMLNVSLGYCLVEMNSYKEAVQLHDLLNALGDNFTINDKPVQVTYWRKPSAIQSENAKAKASLALSAAQWTNQSQVQNSYYGHHHHQQHLDSSSMTAYDNQGGAVAPVLPDLGTVNVGGVLYKKYPMPNVSTFQYDSTSGFHYDRQTGFYYDAKSTYYFNPLSQQYMYWDGNYQAYIPVPSTTTTTTTTTTTAVVANTQQQAVSTTSVTTALSTHTTTAPTVGPSVEATVGPKPPSPPASQEDTADGQDSKQAGGKKKDKSKLLEAKKISKDMERWARMQDKKKNIARQSMLAFNVQASRPSAEDVGYSVLEKEASKTLREMGLQNRRDEESQQPSSSSLAFLADYGEDDNTDDHEDNTNSGGPPSLKSIEEELAKLIDWEKLACLLCKRKFSSREILSKHEKHSDLHLKNLEAVKATKLGGLLPSTDQEKPVFRDRARERREKYGQPEVPMPTSFGLKRKAEEDTIAYEEPTKFGIGSDHKGHKLLKAMGWNEGQGLGKDNQGNTEILGVTQRSGSMGLGAPAANPAPTTSFDYRKYGKKLMHSRYYEMP